MRPFDFLAKAARARPEAIAAEDGRQAITFRDLVARSSALAAGVQDLARTARPRVVFLAPNSLDMLVAIMAVHAAQGWLVPLNPRNARAEIDGQIGAARPDLLIADEAHAGIGTDHGIPTILTGAGDGGALTLAGLVRANGGREPTGPRADLGEPNAIKFTGGSSGRPKGVLQSFRCFNTVVASMLLAFDFRADERYLVAAPMTHGAGMFLMPVLARGGRCVVLDKPKPDLLLDAMEHFCVTTTWLPPTLLYMLLEAPHVERRRYALRHLIWGGAPAAPEKLLRARAVFGPCVEAVYGQTEASTIATALRAREVEEDEGRLLSVGRATPLTAVEIMDSEGRLLPAGSMGEIVLRGDLLMNGYLDMPEATARTIVDGWLHTGDVGALDERGYLFIKDRIRDVVISGGFNVYPSDVEAALSRHPAVHEAVVFGLPDAKWGERVEVAVQLKAGAEATPEDLLVFAKTELGSVKAPKHVHIVADLPRSVVGKVLRREVKAHFLAEADGSPAPPTPASEAISAQGG